MIGKLAFCSICTLNLDGWLLACANKTFTIASMFRLSMAKNRRMCLAGSFLQNECILSRILKCEVQDISYHLCNNKKKENNGRNWKSIAKVLAA